MIALLLLASSWGWGTESFDGWPPPRYAHDSKAHVTFVAPDRIAVACDEPDPDHTLEACQEGGRIVLPNPCSFPAKDDFARIACHELAHVNGWPADHPR